MFNKTTTVNHLNTEIEKLIADLLQNGKGEWFESEKKTLIHTGLITKIIHYYNNEEWHVHLIDKSYVTLYEKDIVKLIAILKKYNNTLSD